MIFVAHRKSDEGEIRTRRLFSTLNRYAKPVDISEIIALDEEDNVAIITRNVIEYFDLFKGRILFNKNRSISPKNKQAFSNIIVLYDLIKILLTNNTVFGIKVSGLDANDILKKRLPDEIIIEKQKFVELLFSELFESIPVFINYNQTNIIEREALNSSLLFKPIGQIILFSVLKVCIDKDLKEDALKFFKTEDFSFQNKIWRTIFYDEETRNIKTNKSLQKYATQLILMKIGVAISLTAKDLTIHRNFNLEL